MFRKSKKNIWTKAEDLPMTPMIDVVFLLLIYFLLTLSPEDLKTHLEVYRPSLSPDDVVDFNELLKIEVFSDGYVLNGKPLDQAHMETVLAHLAKLDAEQSVLVVCSSLSPHDRLVAVLDRCAKVGLSNLSVMSAK